MFGNIFGIRRNEQKALRRLFLRKLGVDLRRNGRHLTTELRKQRTVRFQRRIGNKDPFDGTVMAQEFLRQMHAFAEEKPPALALRPLPQPYDGLHGFIGS